MNNVEFIVPYSSEYFNILCVNYNESFFPSSFLLMVARKVATFHLLNLFNFHVGPSDLFSIPSDKIDVKRDN